MLVKRSRRMWILYAIFFAYVLVVVLFLVSMILQSAVRKPSKGKDLPRYMNDVEIRKVKIGGHGSLDMRLKIAVEKADKNKNDYLEKDELSNWIETKISEHITVGVKNNFQAFLKLDNSPKDGWVSLSEYESLFLSSRDVKSEHELSRPAKEQLSRERAEFFEAASDQEQLNIDELLRFRHPECSHARLLESVDRVIEALDEDGDGALSSAELLQLTAPEYHPSEEELAVFPSHDADHMRVLFSWLDLDSDDRLDQHELLVYADPRHAQHAAVDARRLLDLADADGDGRLALPEMLTHAQSFRVLVDARHKFHQPEDIR